MHLYNRVTMTKLQAQEGGALSKSQFDKLFHEHQLGMDQAYGRLERQRLHVWMVLSDEVEGALDTDDSFGGIGEEKDDDQEDTVWDTQNLCEYSHR